MQKTIAAAIVVALSLPSIAVAGDSGGNHHHPQMTYYYSRQEVVSPAMVIIVPGMTIIGSKYFSSNTLLALQVAGVIGGQMIYIPTTIISTMQAVPVPSK